MEETAFQAIAEPRRREILRLLRERPQSVNELTTHFDVSQQAVSHHLQVLKEAGLVAVRPEGQRRLYLVRSEGLESIRAFLADFWPSKLEELKSAVESERRG